MVGETLERRCKAREGYAGERRSGSPGGKLLGDHDGGGKLWRVKPRSVEGGKRSSRARELDTVERVAKPWGRDFQGVGRNFLDALPKGEWKEGFPDPEMLKGVKAYARGSSSTDHGRRGTWVEGRPR